MLLMLLYYALELLKWLIIARVIISWVAPHEHNQVIRLVHRVTDPIVNPLREVIPVMGGLDVSPLVAFFAIHLTQTMLMRL